MKKKLLAMLALSAVLAMSAGLLAACNDPKDPDDPDTPCTEHADKDNDGKCDNCGEDMGGEPVTPPEETKITDGVFSNQMDSSHEALIKLYEDGTAYLSGFTVSYKGTEKGRANGSPSIPPSISGRTKQRPSPSPSMQARQRKTISLRPVSAMRTARQQTPLLTTARTT